MNLARVSTAVAACVVLGAAGAACSGSFGSGTGLPSTMATPNFGGNASPTPPSTSSSVILTYGESTAFQALPEVGGYGGAIAFPKAPEPTAAPAPKGKGKSGSPEPAPTPVAVSIGATLFIVKPEDGPDLNFVSGKGKRKRIRDLPARAFAYIRLLPTHDATLESFPRVQIDVPREVASQYRDGEFGLALWNAGEKDAKYRLAVAELDTAATPPPLRVLASAGAPSGSPGATTKPGAATSTPAASPTARIVTVSPAPGSSAGPGSGSPAPTAAPTLPPARLLFAGTAAPFKLVANRPAVFALYALPHPATPGAKASGSSAAASAAATKPASAATSSAPSASSSASPSATKAPR